jgi:phage terminase large subunit GpA-like protein
MGSTANWPDGDIHWWFSKGTQHRFHTRCPACGDASPLDDCFPDCVGYDPEREDYRYRCHACRGWIDDPQDGEWRPLNPDAKIASLHFTQFLSPTISPRELIEAYHQADDMESL